MGNCCNATCLLAQAHCITHDMESGTDYRKLAHPRLGMYFTGPHA